MFLSLGTVGGEIAIKTEGLSLTMLWPADPDTRALKLFYPLVGIGSGGWEVKRVVVVCSTPLCCRGAALFLLRPVGGEKGSGNDKLLVCLIV